MDLAGDASSSWPIGQEQSFPVSCAASHQREISHLKRMTDYVVKLNE